MTDAIDAAWLSGETYDALRARDFERFVTAGRKDLTAHVPTCPDWDMTALCDHLARVYQGRAYTIVHAEFIDRSQFQLRTEGDDPIAWVQRWDAALNDALRGRGDDAPTVTFMPSATTVHFWRRRMALETLVHRTDAELAIGAVSPMDDALSADGVDELLWFGTHPENDHADGIAATSVVELTDGGRVWRVALSDGAMDVASTAAPDVTVRGAAPALLLAASGRDLDGIGVDRFGVSPLSIDGDPAAYQRLLARLGAF